PPGWFEQWADATWATDPIGSKQTPPVLRAPNGVLQDLRTYWAAGNAQYDPGNIRVPTLLIHAEWDADLPSDQAQEPTEVLPRGDEFSRGGLSAGFELCCSGRAKPSHLRHQHPAQLALAALVHS